MQFLFFIASRYLRSRWRQTMMLVLSVAVGVAILTTALSLTNGFSTDLVQRILGTTPHINVSNSLTGTIQQHAKLQAELSTFPHVSKVFPYVYGQALLTRGVSGFSLGVLMRGVDPEQEKHNPDWIKNITQGDLKPRSGLPGIMLGSELAKRLGVALGDRLLLVTPQAKRQLLVVSGIYQAGLYEYDAHVAFVDLKVAQQALSLGEAVTGLAVRLDDVFKAPEVASLIQQDVPYNIQSWTQSNKSLLGALLLEKRVIFLVTMFIVIVAAMGIANTLAMWVLEQSREIAILRAIGASGALMSRLVMLEGAMVGVLGVVVGLVSGFGLSMLVAAYPVALPAEVYYIDRLPVRMEVADFAGTAIAALFIVILASLLPARRAFRLDPIEVIRRA